MSVIEDLKGMKNWVAGVITFATLIGGFLVQMFHLPPEPTTLSIVIISILVIGLVWLIKKSEERQKESILKYQKEMDNKLSQTVQSLDQITKVMLEIQKSSLRTEMNLMMAQNPSNHDTILKMAHRYFVELDGDWVETDEFETWREHEKENGRPVHASPILANTITSLKEQEK